MKLTDKIYFYPESGMLDCNTYVIKDKVNIIIDPGFLQYLPAKLKAMGQDGIEPKNINIITNTHLHGDHYWANEEFKKLSGAKIVIHPLQKQFYDINVFEVARFFSFPPVELKEDSYLEDHKLNTGEMEFELIPAPGHSPDSVCFYARKEKILICGDVIFHQNTGRVDLPGGSATELKQSIEKLARLEIDYLLPGHMDTVNGAEKVKKNFEFVREYVFGWL